MNISLFNYYSKNIERILNRNNQSIENNKRFKKSLTSILNVISVKILRKKVYYYMKHVGNDLCDSILLKKKQELQKNGQLNHNI